MIESGKVSVAVENGIGTITFFHPKSNSLPGSLLAEMARTVTSCGENDDIRVIVLKSEGNRAFCAGASFAELTAVKDPEGGKEFFMGFARLILAMKKCPKFIIARLQGKAVGGGVGVTAAADYAFAHTSSSAKLSELALGLGPFVVGPAVERKVGAGPFAAFTVDTDWRDAAWCERHGLYAGVFETHEALDEATNKLATKLAGFNPEAMAELKKVFWEGTEHWDTLLEERAVQSGRLVLSDFTSKAIAAFAERIK